MLNADPRMAEDVTPTMSQTQFLRVAFDALAIRIIRWITLLMAFGLFAAVMWRPDWVRFAAAVGFTCLVFLPVLLTKRG